MPDKNTGNAGNVFHAGEIALQHQLGVADRLEEIGRRMVHREFPEQHRSFYSQLPFIIAGAVDREDDVWAMLLAGEAGFLTSPSADRLVITSTIDRSDPGASGIETGHPVGLLGIELDTRRRNRLNGVITTDRSGRYEVHVRQAFGNCPQYIRLRDYRFVRSPSLPMEADSAWLEHLDTAARSLIQSADTFFVASYADMEGDRQVDVSHRGGMPGFVQISGDGLLTIPDYRGNRHFNTLGNILVNPKAGLLFIDFETGDLLQLAGDAAVDNDPRIAAILPGAERAWTFRPRKIVRRLAASPLRWMAREDGHSRASPALALGPDHSTRVAPRSAGEGRRLPLAPTS